MPKAIVMILGLIMNGFLSGQDFPVFPKDVNSWKAELTQSFSQQNLYQYIDGAAELYISYGCLKLCSIRYSLKGEPEIVLDIFDMGNSFNAFGIFSQSQEHPGKEFGQGSEYLDGLLRFWKGRFYFSILASPENARVREALWSLGRHMENAIEANGPLPEILNYLPESGVVHETLRFFVHPAWQNSHYHFSDGNPLDIQADCQGVTARYGSKENRMVLLVVLYPVEGRAKSAMENLRKALPIHEGDEGIARLPDGTWSAVIQKGRFVGALFMGRTQEETRFGIRDLLKAFP